MRSWIKQHEQAIPALREGDGFSNPQFSGVASLGNCKLHVQLDYLSKNKVESDREKQLMVTASLHTGTQGEVYGYVY